MDGVGESFESGSGLSSSQLMKNGAFRDEESCSKHVSPIRGGG